jgi:hypothetical protein
MPRTSGVDPRRVERVLNSVTFPTFERLLQADVLDGIRPATALRAFRELMPAVIQLQLEGTLPTDAALHRHGGPAPDSIKRFFERTDLSDLPGAHTRTAVDGGLVEVPSLVVVEARTEPTSGPDKFGTAHLEPPPRIHPARGRRGAPNTEGGIASAIALADCGGVPLPLGDVPLQQHWWNPGSYPAEEAEAVESQLRSRADFHERPFVDDPEGVARLLVARLGSIESLAAWGVPLDDLILAGGRLRIGFPAVSPLEFGAGRQDRYLGCDLEALRRVHESGLDAFFELPVVARGRGHESPAWRIRRGREDLSLGEIERLAHDLASPWTFVAPAVTAGITGGRANVGYLAARAVDGIGAPIDVTLMCVVDHLGRFDLHITTGQVAPGDAVGLEHLVRLALGEAARRMPGSPMETAFHSLLQDGWCQSNQRRRYPDRRSFSAVAQAAFGVIELALRMES